MILIVGLGNPGKKYENNRHNVGHMFIDYCTSLSSRRRSGSRLKFDALDSGLRRNDGIELIKTDCFMNQSGLFVKKFVIRNSLINNLIIIHDDLDIPFGKFHIQKGVGPRLHNGLESIEQNMKSKDFWRLRVGVDNRVPERWTDGIKYVLRDFLSEERIKLENEIFSKILTQLKIFLKTELSLKIF